MLKHKELINSERVLCRVWVRTKIITDQIDISIFYQIRLGQFYINSYIFNRICIDYLHYDSMYKVYISCFSF